MHLLEDIKEKKYEIECIRKNIVVENEEENELLMKNVEIENEWLALTRSKKKFATKIEVKFKLS